MFDDDICWCYNSQEEEGSNCEQKNCFRHLSNRKKPESGPDIFTVSCLKGTIYCPYCKENKNDI